MKSAGLIERIDDSINPIVVKELRQAVHSKFVVAVVLLFLILQLLMLGLYLMLAAVNNRLEMIDYQAGRDVFSWLQGILLATCMLFLPAWSGLRLAAERSEVNTDLLFITTLQPRKIISGKLASAVVIAVMIFSACTPFMAFTYFLRGIDLPAIFFVVAIDFLVVIGSVHVMVLFAVVPANRVLKALLGVIGFAVLIAVFILTLVGTLSLVQFGLNLFEENKFWIFASVVLMSYVAACGLLFTWSIGLICSPSANRTLPMRIFVLGYTVVSGLLHAYLSRLGDQEFPMQMWILEMGVILFLCVIIAVNERESWSPRVARTIPRNPLLRVPAFFLYSGSAGGLFFAFLIAGFTYLGKWLFEMWFPATGMRDFGNTLLRVMGILVLYAYCYGLSAVLARTWLTRLPPGFTWVLMIFVTAIGSLVPIFIAFVIYFNSWRYDEVVYWLLPNPVAAALEMGATAGVHADLFLAFAVSWAGLVTILNLRWFFRQMRAFRPYDASTATVLPARGEGSSSVTLPVSGST